MRFRGSTKNHHDAIKDASETTKLKNTAMDMAGNAATSGCHKFLLPGSPIAKDMNKNTAKTVGQRGGSATLVPSVKDDDNKVISSAFAVSFLKRQFTKDDGRFRSIISLAHTLPHSLRSPARVHASPFAPLVHTLPEASFLSHTHTHFPLARLPSPPIACAFLVSPFPPSFSVYFVSLVSSISLSLHSRLSSRRWM